MTGSEFTTEFLARFRSRYCEGDGCWVWTAAKDRKGYGAISFNRKMLKAHRVAWEIENGRRLGRDTLVCHHCDTPACVNPAHLFIGVPADNSADMVRKGRHRVGVRHRGEANGGAKATIAIVHEIRALTKAGLGSRQIASRVGISASQVLNIVNGKHWSWL